MKFATLKPDTVTLTLVFFAQHCLNGNGGQSLEGKKVVISGSGQVALAVAEKCIELGAKVICLCDSTGYVVEEEGFDMDKLEGIRAIKVRELSALIT